MVPKYLMEQYDGGLKSAISQLSDPKREEKLTILFQKFGEQLWTAPCSTKEEYHGCFEGGLISHILRTVSALETFVPEWGLSDLFPSAVFVALTARLGKLGIPGNPLYLKTTEQWQQKKGILYENNPSLVPMEIGDRSLYLLQRSGIPVTDNEWLAIKLYAGLYQESNAWYYRYHGDQLPKLVHLIHQADLFVTQTTPKP